MEQNLLNETALALKQEWHLSLPELVSEENILNALTDQIGILQAQGPEAFFRLMYRLDISEKKLMSVIQTKDVAEKIARLIYDRQLQKIRSRLLYKRNDTVEDSDLKW